MKPARDASASSYLTDALLLLLPNTPFSDITVTALCKKAGVTRMSFYRSFTTKEDVLRAWITAVTEDFLRTSQISYQNDSTERYFIKLFTHLGQHADICLALYRDGLIHLVKDEFDRVFVTLHRHEYDVYKSRFLSGGIYNIFLLWLEHGCADTPAQLAARLSDLLAR